MQIGNTALWHFWSAIVIKWSPSSEQEESNLIFGYCERLNCQYVTHILKFTAFCFAWQRQFQPGSMKLRYKQYIHIGPKYLQKIEDRQMSNKGLKVHALKCRRHKTLVQMANNFNCENRSCIEWPSIIRTV